MTWRYTNVEDVREEFAKTAHREVVNFTELCQQFEISRKTGYKWLGRYQEGGIQNLSDRSRAARNRPNETPKEIKKLIIETRKKFVHWGAKKIIPYLAKKYPNLVLPSETTVGNILRREGLTPEARSSPKMAGTSPVTEAKYPNHVWTIDFKGWWKTGDNSVCEPLTVTDLYSKYILHVDHIESKSVEPVWEVLENLFERYGKPNMLRSDNGPPFASVAVGRLSQLSIRLIKAGITPEWTRPGKPQDNGSHERMHRTFKEEVSLDPAPTLKLQREQCVEFKPYFNEIRPHEAIGMKTPSEVHVIADHSAKDGSLLEYPESYLRRKVECGGMISIHGYRAFISEMLRGEYIGAEPVSSQDYRLHYGPIFIGSLNIHEGFKRF